MSHDQKIFVPENIAKARSTVVRMYPGAAVIARCDGGHMVFVSRYSYLAWTKQK